MAETETTGLGFLPYTKGEADSAFAPASKGVTNGDAHNHNGGDGGQIAYSSLSGTPTIPSASSATPLIESGTGAAGTGAEFSRYDHVHPAGAGGGGIVTTTTFDIVAGASIAAGRGVFLDSTGKADQGVNAILSDGGKSIINVASLLPPQIKYLDATHFVVAWNNNTNYLNVTCGSISGTTITYGANAQIHTTASETWFSLAVLDSTHFVIGYAKATTANYARCGSISGVTITLGAEATTAASATTAATNSSIVALDATHFACGYLYTKAYGVVCSVSTVTITVGTAVKISDTTYNATYQILALDSTHIVLPMFATSGTKVYAACGSISGTAITWDAGGVVDMGTFATPTGVSVLTLSSSLFILHVWKYTTYATMIACSVSGTTITKGTPVNNAITLTIVASKLIYRDATHFIMFAGYTVALCSCSGTGNRTITEDASVAVSDCTGPAVADATSIMNELCMGDDANTFIHVYTASNKSIIQKGTISGATITWNVAALLHNVATGAGLSVIRLSTNLFVSVVSTGTQVYQYVHSAVDSAGIILAGIAKAADDGSSVDVYQVHTYLTGYTGLTNGTTYYMGLDGLPRSYTSTHYYPRTEAIVSMTLGQAVGTTAILVNTDKDESTKLY
ncbi:MAG: hypothetical protein AB2L14_25235 [Candidatus Xenobiia bacterium LiM19]